MSIITVGSYSKAPSRKYREPTEMMGLGVEGTAGASIATNIAVSDP